MFLLDPTTAITKDGVSGYGDPSYALGLKFRYFRDQAGISAKSMAQKAGLTIDTITSIEQGVLVPLRHYLVYLEALHLSWKEFAILGVPDEFVQAMQTPRHMHLRLCPNSKCSNHHPPPGTSVQLLRDMPEQRIARFHCTICGRRFTISYDGNLRIKTRLPRLRVGKPHILVKSQDEIASLIEMGMRGDCNRKIAHSLGWGVCTVRVY